MSTERKIAIYSRKSKMTLKGESIANQIEMSKNKAKKLNPNVTDDDLLIFQDEGYSGKDTKRPQFQEMLSLIKQNKISHVICYRLDRISRSVADFYNFYQELERHNVYFILANGNIDTTTPMGKLFLGMTALFAELERNVLRERIIDNYYMNTRRGVWLGGSVPIGYSITSINTTTTDSGKQRKGKTLQIVPEQAETVKQLFEKYIELGSLSKLDIYCQQNNIKTANNKSFTTSTLKTVLSNHVYCTADNVAYNYFIEEGYQVYGDEEDFTGEYAIISYNKGKRNDPDDTLLSPDAPRKPNQKYATPHVRVLNPNNEVIITVSKHKPIVSSSIFIKVQKLLQRNASKSYNHPKTHIALLSGILKCRYCGSPMRPRTYTTQYDPEHKRYYYECSLKDKSKKLCHAPNIQGNEFDNAVWDTISHLAYDQGSLVQQLQNQLTSHYNDTDSYNSIINELQSKCKQLQKQIDTATTNLTMITSPQVIKTLSDKITELTSQLNDTKNKINHYQELIKKSQQNNTVYDEFIETLLKFKPDFYDKLTVDQKIPIIRNIVSKITYDYDTKIITLFLTTDTTINLNLNNPKMPDTVNSSSSTTNVALNNTPDLETKMPDTVNSITSTFNVALNINILSTNLHNLYLLTYYKNNFSNFLVQAPLYIHQFKFCNYMYFPDAQDFLINYPDPSILSTPLKLKYYRYINGFLQKEIAQYLNICLKTYANYEQDTMTSYDPEHIKLLCKLYHLAPADLLDDYNLFLYHNYHNKLLKQYRLDHNYTQAQFAKILGIQTYLYVSYEELTSIPTKPTYEKLFKYIK